jgi:hypothetical protein
MKYQTPVSELKSGDLTKPFVVETLIKEPTKPTTHHTTAFIDTRAMGNFIHPKLVTCLGLHMEE